MRSAFEVFRAFLKLGLTSFGGPVAHLAYFRAEFVERRAWLDDRSYADLVALCQFLPGPASSQVGIALGLARAGWPGALAAWAGFTLPSAIGLMLLAMGVTQWGELAQSGAVHGLKLVAVAVVAQALLGMARTLCPDLARAAVATVAAALVLAVASTAGQILAIAAGGVAGRWAVQFQRLPATPGPGFGLGKRTGAMLLFALVALLLLLPLLADALQSPALAVFASVYRAGALVFGGGHVVLPLLQASVVPSGLLSQDVFLAGYGVVQAMPGPLFNFAAYLGAAMTGPLGGWLGGLALLVAIFLPGFLVVTGALPFWEQIRQHHNAQRAMAGVNAAVVGVLAAALYDPVSTSAIHSPLDLALALCALGLLMLVRVPPAVVVALAAGAGWLLASAT